MGGKCFKLKLSDGEQKQMQLYRGSFQVAWSWFYADRLRSSYAISQAYNQPTQGDNSGISPAARVPRERYTIACLCQYVVYVLSRESILHSSPSLAMGLDIRRSLPCWRVSLSLLFNIFLLTTGIWDRYFEVDVS